jgi:glycosyltransferase involved in cell wall biosynthesis
MDKQTRFVVAAPGRWDGDNNARALANHGLLRFEALGTRRGAAGVPPELMRLNPKIGLAAYIAARTLSAYQAESFRFRLLPWFDAWVKKQLVPGDHILSSYGFTNACFKWVRTHGGTTLLSAGNSHPENFWEIVAEEHRRWKSPYPPIPPHWNRRAREMMEDVDLVLSPSSYVSESFLTRGFPPERILRNVYPVDLSYFHPANLPRPKTRPLTIVSTGSLSLRKGSPYLLEAFRIVRKSIPDARLLLTQIVEDSVKNIVPKYSDLNIEWSPSLPHPQLAERLRSADIFVLPSLEEGLARTGVEALACGLPAIVTPNTGVNDWIIAGKNGEVVPIRDASAIAEAILKWAEPVCTSEPRQSMLLHGKEFSAEYFDRCFIQQVEKVGLLVNTSAG